MMTIDWGKLIGIVLPMVVALTPWLVVMHSKLAVLVSQMKDLKAEVAKLVQSGERRVPMCVEHDQRLQELERRIDQVGD